MTNYTITGYPDDLIYVDDDDYGTIGEYNTYDTVATIETKDGWKYTFEYAGPFWEFTLWQTGTGPEPQLVKATDEDDDYSDSLIIINGFSVIIRGKTYTWKD